ncbi:MAG TPA: hypothetical protein VFW07_27075, partial [Parafilimonas sp.]|nr:hypothetical protein [Parafilimonas sp.]
MNFEEFGNKHGCRWLNIAGARQKTAENKQIIFDTLVSHGMPAFSNDMDLVLFGSIARNECTLASDADWTLLIDGQSNPNHDSIGRIVRKKLSESSLIDPSPSGLFGQLTFSHDLIHFIGGEEDTNFNITRRILLLPKIRKQKIRSKKYLSFWALFVKIGLKAYKSHLNFSTGKQNMQYELC